MPMGTVISRAKSLGLRLGIMVLLAKQVPWGADDWWKHSSCMPRRHPSSFNISFRFSRLGVSFPCAPH